MQVKYMSDKTCNDRPDGNRTFFVKLPDVDKKNTLDKLVSFSVDKINYARNYGGIAFMRKY